MVSKSVQVILVVVFLVAAWTFVAIPAQAVDFHTPLPNPNYYVAPTGGTPVGAELYVCPRPTPAHVGHTYITYEPFAPHEFLYPHQRVYCRNNPCVGNTTTLCWWRNAPLLNAQPLPPLFKTFGRVLSFGH